MIRRKKVPGIMPNIIGFGKEVNRVRMPPGLRVGWMPIFDDEKGMSCRISISMDTKDADTPSKDFNLNANTELSWSDVGMGKDLAARYGNLSIELYRHEVCEWTAIGDDRFWKPEHEKKDSV